MISTSFALNDGDEFSCFILSLHRKIVDSSKKKNDIWKLITAKEKSLFLITHFKSQNPIEKTFKYRDLFIILITTNPKNALTK